MAISTGKKARKAHGNRFAAKRAKQKKQKRKKFGQLPWSASRENVEGWQRGVID